jgi:hypothetical protein
MARPRRKKLEDTPDARHRSLLRQRDKHVSYKDWDQDPYMLGLYNGMEFALSVLDGREPKFHDPKDGPLVLETPTEPQEAEILPLTEGQPERKKRAVKKKAVSKKVGEATQEPKA